MRPIVKTFKVGVAEGFGDLLDSSPSAKLLATSAIAALTATKAAASDARGEDAAPR